MVRLLAVMLAAAALFSSAAAAILSHPDAFTFASYNIMYTGGYAPNHPRDWQKRMTRVAELVLKREIDVFGCQEPKAPDQLARSVLMDSQEIAKHQHYGPEQTFHGWTGKPLCRLDYVFVTPSVKVLTHQTVTDDIADEKGNLEPPSDHCPVMIEVLLTDPSAL